MTLKEYIIENLHIFEDVKINSIFDNIDAKFDPKAIGQILLDKNVHMMKNITLENAYDMLNECMSSYVEAKDEQIKEIIKNSFNDKKYEKLLSLFNDDNKTTDTSNTSQNNKQISQTQPNSKETVKTNNLTKDEIPKSTEDKEEIAAIIFISELIPVYSDYINIINDNIEIINGFLPKISSNDIAIELTKLMLMYKYNNTEPLQINITKNKASQYLSKEIISIFIYLMVQNDIIESKIDKKFLDNLLSMFEVNTKKK